MTPRAGAKPIALLGVVVVEAARLEEAELTAEATAEGWAELNEATTDELAEAMADKLAAEETEAEGAEDTETTPDVITEGEMGSEVAEPTVDDTWLTADSVGEDDVVIADDVEGLTSENVDSALALLDSVVRVSDLVVEVLVAVVVVPGDSVTPGQPLIQFW